MNHHWIHLKREKKASFNQPKFTFSILAGRSIIFLFIVIKMNTAVTMNILFSVIQNNKAFG